ncbi:MAG: acyltransferase, partial [Casimicrobiaceae bacterium]
RFDSLLDVTIIYPNGAPTFWQFLCGDLCHIVVRAQCITIPPAFRDGDYARDPKYRKTFQRWLQALWHEKDARIDALVELPGSRRLPRPT